MFDVIKTFGGTFLKGRLTYVVAAVGLIAATLMYATNLIPEATFIMLVNANLVALGLRRAIK